MTTRSFMLTALAVSLALVALAPAASAKSDAPAALDRMSIPAGEVSFARVADACSPCATPCAIPRNDLCCSFRDWDDCAWNFKIAVGAYIAGMKGTLGVRGAQFDMDTSVGDSLDAFFDYGESILQGSVAVGKGRWTLELLYSGMEFKKGLKVDLLGIPIENNVKIQQWGAKLYYRAAETKLNCRPCPWLLVWEPMIGVRGNSLSIDIEGGRGFGLSQSKSWADPIVGCRITWDLRNKWGFIVDGDIGGFGVSSELTWRLKLAAGYRFARWFTLSGGWIWIDTDYTDGEFTQKFTWDIQQSGPFLALNFTF